MAGLVPATHRATIATACWETQVAPRTHDYFVYMLASKPYGTIYIGVTNDLRRRVGEHLDWPRNWKINLIERDNPRWDDLGVRLTG
jgi:predicted GIY-YIG superfamily endonuclease